MSWSTNGGYLSLSGSGFYRTITVNQYFSGTATVTCEWDYKLTGNGRYTHTKRQVTISCRDNQVSISPTSITLSQGDVGHVGYQHQYDNQYTSVAHAYFKTSNPSVCTVSSSGEVHAVGPGTAYINVYSKISSVVPYCLVTVKNPKPTSISIPSNLKLTIGEKKTIHPTLYPSNAIANIFWESSNPDIACVSSGGTVSGLKHGTAIITARTDNGITSTCNVTVEKNKLSINAIPSSGLITKGTPIELFASESDAKIYYTTDGSNPNPSSLYYSNPILITENTQVKAYAVHPDYLDSEILNLNFEITSLILEQILPEQGIDVKPHLYPCFEFNQNIRHSFAFDDIRLYSNNNEVAFDKVIQGHKLFVVPDKLDRKNIRIEIPQGAVESFSNDVNVKINAQFDYTSAEPTCISRWTKNSRIMDNGDCYIWGRPSYFPDKSARPDKYTGFPRLALSNVKEIYDENALGYYITKDNILMGWIRYDNGDRALGDGTTEWKSEAIQIASDVIKMEIDDSYIKGILKSDATLWLWGYNNHGQIGNGKSGENETVLSPTKILTDVKDFSLNGWHSLALKNDGSVWAWGYNKAIGKDSDSTIPIEIISGDVIEIKAGGAHNIILKSNGEVYCFGENEWGQIGNGYQSEYESPYRVMTEVKHIYASDGGSFALKKNGDLYRWGGLYYSLNATCTSTPILVAQDVREVFPSFSYLLLLKRDNTVWRLDKKDDSKSLELEFKNHEEASATKLSKVYNDVERILYVCPNGQKIIVQKTDGTYWGIGSELGISESDEIYEEPVEILKGTVVQSENISLPDKIIIEFDQKGFAQVEITPSNANYEYIEWTSKNPTIAEISNNGVITPVSLGETAIEVHIIDNLNNPYASCAVQVIEKGSGIDNILSSLRNDIYSIYNVNGIKLYEGNKDNIPQLNSGIYIIVSQEKTIKFIKR